MRGFDKYESSASAAELFSSAMHHLNSAPLVGTRVTRKEIGQEYYELSDGSGLKFTTFHYMTKSRLDYDGIGLIPDYETEHPRKNRRIIFSVLDETSGSQLIKSFGSHGYFTVLRILNPRKASALTIEIGD